MRAGVTRPPGWWTRQPEAAGARSRRRSRARTAGRREPAGASTTLITKIAAVSTAATWTSSIENFRSPTWNSVSGWRSPRPRAIRPNSAAPVRDHHPGARARSHHRAHQRAACSTRPAAVPAGTVSADFSTGTDSPVITDSSHSSPAAASSRTSAGTTSPSCRSTMSPGTSSVTSADARMPAPPHDAAMLDLRVQGLSGLLGPVLVDEAQAHRGQQDQPDDHRVAALANEVGREGRDRQQDQQRRAELPPQDRQRPRTMGADRVRPERPQPPGRLRRREARPVAAQPGQDAGYR